MSKALILAALVAVCMADLRMASQPKNAFKALDRNNKAPFVPNPKVQKYALYMEPSDFNYAGLKAQRANAYDNFLRSNIDNEQDRRNFQTEPGRDHLPFRSYETAAIDASATVETKIPNVAPGPAITTKVNTPYLVPLRWNNPHSAELEVNIWIMKRSGVNNKPVVVPIRYPTCSGEGHQDNVFSFTIPTAFLNLGTKVPGFAGCTKVGDCVLQIYAHSVESRTYAMGTPLIVDGTLGPVTATTDAQIVAPKKDAGVDKTAFETLRHICRPSNDPTADIVTPVPQWPRLVSDVFNHAYQNSDFSPYSGQQPDQISQNMQASAILKMTVGDRGELGKQFLAKTNPKAAALAKKLDNKASELIRVYESITNQIIARIGDEMPSEDTTLVEGQKTDKGFRCAETGAVNKNRLTTNTYVPSFVISNQTLYDQALLYVAPIYKALITKQSSGGIVQIYNAVLNDLHEEFVLAGEVGLKYLGPMLKDTLTTKEDATQFIKVDAAGQADKGYYAASLAKPKITENSKANIASDILITLKPISANALNSATSSLHNLLVNAGASFFAAAQADMNGVMTDSNCDNDASFAGLTDDQKAGVGCVIPGMQYPRPGQLFLEPDQIALNTAGGANSAATAGVSFVAVFAVIVACFAN